MKNTNTYSRILNRSLIGALAIGLTLIFASGAEAQNRMEEYTGNIISFNGPQVQTSTFTLKFDRLTTDEQAKLNLAILRKDGQDKLLSNIRKEDVGTFSIGNQLARTVNVVRESQVDGKTRVFVVFERWMQFAELRGGYRSADYPFGVIELFIDPDTGKGDGTFIAAARIRWDDDKKAGTENVEIENFATYPAKLFNVKMNIKAQ